MTDREVMQQALEALESGLAFDTHSDVLQNLRTALEQQAEPPPEWESIKNILDEYGLDAIAFVAKWRAAQQQAEPVAQRKPLTDELYNELLFAVGSKYPDETRHQTALRYIRRAEMRSASPEQAAHNIKEQP